METYTYFLLVAGQQQGLYVTQVCGTFNVRANDISNSVLPRSDIVESANKKTYEGSNFYCQ